MTQFDTNNTNAPHTLRELGAEPPPAADVTTVAVTRLLARHGLTDVAHPAVIALADYVGRLREALVSQTSRALDFLDKAEAAEVEVARLTAGLSLWIDRAEAAEAEVARLRKALATLVDHEPFEDGKYLSAELVEKLNNARAAMRKGGAA